MTADGDDDPPIIIKRILTKSREFYQQLTLNEISGAFGDVGTFVPLAVALAQQRVIYLGPAFFWAGMSNIVTGLIWDVPMCVQPMKSIAAVALADNLSRQQVTAAGIWMGVFLCLLCVTNGIEWINRLVPTPVVSGIQMGVGINLSIRGIVMIQKLEWFGHLDCIALAVVVALLCLYLIRDENIFTINADSNQEGREEEEHSISHQAPTPSSRKPSAPVGLYLVGLAVLLAIVPLIFESKDADDEKPTETTSGHWLQVPIKWALVDMTWNDWKQGLLQGAIPQLPLTTLNSVVSVCCLAHTLYPEKRRTYSSVSSASSFDGVISRLEVCWSVGLMNLLLCPLGAMPCCHGAGGLAGQHKFGARHGSSVVFLGLNKILLATLLSGSLLVAVLDALPMSVLGLMLFVCGHELATMGLKVLIQSACASSSSSNSTSVESIDAQSLRRNSVVALVTVIVDVGLHKTHVAALSGYITYMIYGNGVMAWRQHSLGRHDDAEGTTELVRDNHGDEADEDETDSGAKPAISFSGKFL